MLGRARDLISRFDSFAVAFAFCLFALLLPLGSALNFGGDEPIEFSKAVLVAKGYRLYQDIWNDQPPLHTVLLAGVFSVFGPDLLAGRLFAVGFGALLITSLYSCVRLVAGPLAGIIAIAWFYTGPNCLTLLHATMLEPAAVSVAVASLWLAMVGASRASTLAIAGSGAVLAVALQIKYTALIVGFAGGVITFWPELVGALSIPIASRMRSSAIWLGSCGLAFCLAAVLLPHVDYATAVQAHTASPQDNLLLPESYALPVLSNLEFWLIAAGAVLTNTRRLKAVAIPLLLFGTALLVHSIHRPYWYYYVLHFAVPVAWLCGVLASGFAATTTRVLRDRPRLSRWLQPLARVGGIILFCGIASGMISRYLLEMRAIQAVEKTDCRPVKMLKAHAADDDSVFTMEKRYTFAAGLRGPPSLCVLPAKRYWCGAISEAGIRAELLSLRTKYVLYRTDQMDYEWQEFLAQYYREVAQTGKIALYEIKPAMPTTNGIVATATRLVPN